MDKKTILILGKLPPPYMGPSVATKIILESELKENFHLIHVDTKTFQSLLEMGRWRMNMIFKNLLIYFKLFWICIKYRPSLVLIPFSQTTGGFLKDSIFIIIAKMTGRKILVQLRGSDFKRWYDSRKVGLRNYVRAVLKSTNGVIVLGDNLRYIFREFFAEEKIFVSPNGADFNFSVSGKTSDKIRILYFANLLEAKGIEDVLEAIKRLIQVGESNFILDVVGEWMLSEKNQKNCVALVKDYALPVAFHPSTSGEKKMRYFAEADIFVFTPRSPEGHPWVLVEALAASLPVISTDQGAIIESVHDGINGFIVPSCSPDMIAKKLKLLFDGEELRKKMGEQSRRLYLEKFTEKKMTERLNNIFQTVIEKE